MHRYLTWLIIGVCIVLTAACALWFRFAQCYSIEWVGGYSSNGWSVFEAWCGPTKRYAGRIRRLDRLKIQKADEQPAILKSGSNVRLFAGSATYEFLYGISDIKIGARAREKVLTLVFRSNEYGDIEICGEIDESIQILYFDDHETSHDLIWADVRIAVDDVGGNRRLGGYLTLQFDQCVDGSDLVSLSFRIRSQLHRIGLVDAPGRELAGLVQLYTERDVVFDIGPPEVGPVSGDDPGEPGEKK